MHVYTVLSPFAAIAVFSAILLHSPGVAAGQDAADWWKAQRNVTDTLMKPGTSIAKLVADVSAATPKNPQDTMFKLSVLMRAGMKKEAIEALRELKAFDSETTSSQVASIYHDACGNALTWDERCISW